VITATLSTYRKLVIETSKQVTVAGCSISVPKNYSNDDAPSVQARTGKYAHRLTCTPCDGDAASGGDLRAGFNIYVTGKIILVIGNKIKYNVARSGCPAEIMFYQPGRIGGNHPNPVLCDSG
jgi:hypothetical protein